MSEIESIVGWAAVVDWFGYSPSFHDAEVLSIDLRREPEPCVIRVHTWRMNDDTDERGYFRLDRHALVTFTLKDIQSANLDGWNYQNVIDEMTVERTVEGLCMRLHSIFGVYGNLTAKQISVGIEPLDPAR